jgi:hypothetical protein
MDKVAIFCIEIFSIPNTTNAIKLFAHHPASYSVIMIGFGFLYKEGFGVAYHDKKKQYKQTSYHDNSLSDATYL